MLDVNDNSPVFDNLKNNNRKKWRDLSNNNIIFKAEANSAEHGDNTKVQYMLATAV